MARHQASIGDETIEMRSCWCRPSASRPLWSPHRKTHTRNILVACCVVALPMVAFTLIILAFVFANTVNNHGCSFNDLCSAAGLMNATSNSYYYVDFSATSLVFISSWSSTISFALVSVLMTIHAYSVAAQLLRVSSSEEDVGAGLSPYQLSLLLRVLSAELLTLWELLNPRGRRALQRAKTTRSCREAKPTILRKSVALLCLGVLIRYVKR